MPYQIVHRRGLVAWLLATFAAGSTAAFHGDVFYFHLFRASWPPAIWVFAAIWGLLNLLAGGAAWLIWKKAGFGGAGVQLGLYLTQLCFHALWCWLFLVRRNTAMAAPTVIVHDLLVVATLVAFWRIRPLAAAMLLPYLVWVGFAYALTMTALERPLTPFD